MPTKLLGSRGMLMLLAAAGLLWFGTAQAVAQTVQEPADDATPTESTEPADVTTPPAYVAELVEAGDLTQERVDQMRTDGMGWGEVRIATRLAEEIAAASNGTLTFDQTLDEVLAARDAGKGFGEIASEHNLKVGELVGNGNQKMDAAEEGELEARQGKELGNTERTATKKRGFLARIGRALGFSKKERVSQASATTDRAVSGKAEKVQKAEKVEKMERPAKPERPEKPEKPTKPERPEKPEKPERGPNR